MCVNILFFFVFFLNVKSLDIINISPHVYEKKKKNCYARVGKQKISCLRVTGLASFRLSHQRNTGEQRPYQ